jgi:sodium/proline symporter
MLLAVNQVIFVASFVAYTLVVVAIGIYAAKFARRSDEDFFLAGRSLGKWVAALSASASSESGWVTLGLVGMGFRFGVQAYWIVPGCLLGFAFIWFVMAGRMRDRAGELGALTVPDFFAAHYQERKPILRVLSVVVILTAMLLYVAAQFAAAGKAFNASFPEDIKYQTGVLIGAGIVMVYTISGGFRAVCWTDFLQALLMLVALVFFPIYILTQHGGYSGLFDMVRTAEPHLLEFWPEKTGWALVGFVLGSSALGINFGYPGQPHVLARFMALKDRREARLGGLIAMTWGGLVLWGAVTVGLAAKALTLGGATWGTVLLGGDGVDPAAASEKALVLASIHLLPEVLAGLVLAAVLAAICSTADSQLVVAASAAANDLYARIFAKDRAGNHVGKDRAVVFVLGLAAVLMVMNKEYEVYKLVLTYGWAIFGAAFGPQLILALLWRGSTYAGCVAGMFTGFVVPIAWQLTYDSTESGVEIYNLPLGFAAALAVHVLVSLTTRSSDGGSQPADG